MVLAAGLPIQAYGCSSHEVVVEQDAPEELRLTLDPAGGFGGNRDFILHYQLAGQQVESGLLLYEGEQENFFLLMAQPPARPEPSQIPPREYIFSSRCIRLHERLPPHSIKGPDEKPARPVTS